MADIYSKLETIKKNILHTQRLIAEGICKREEKSECLELCRSLVSIFPELFSRKAQKIEKLGQWSRVTQDGFVANDESSQFDPWVKLIDEFLEARKIKSECKNDKIHIKSVVDWEDQHIFVSHIGSPEHAHLILDSWTWEIRVDPKDTSPSELITGIEAKLTLITWDIVKVTKSKIEFVEPDLTDGICASVVTRQSYYCTELLNTSDDIILIKEISLYWQDKNWDQTRVLTDFWSENQDLGQDRPSTLSTLTKGQKFYALIPQVTLDWNLTIKLNWSWWTKKTMLSKNVVLNVGVAQD